MPTEEIVERLKQIRRVRISEYHGSDGYTEEMIDNHPHGQWVQHEEIARLIDEIEGWDARKDRALAYMSPPPSGFTPELVESLIQDIKSKFHAGEDVK